MRNREGDQSSISTSPSPQHYCPQKVATYILAARYYKFYFHCFAPYPLLRPLSSISFTMSPPMSSYTAQVAPLLAAISSHQPSTFLPLGPLPSTFPASAPSRPFATDLESVMSRVSSRDQNEKRLIASTVIAHALSSSPETYHLVTVLEAVQEKVKALNLLLSSAQVTLTSSREAKS